MKSLLFTLFLFFIIPSANSQNCDRWFLGGNALYLMPLEEARSNNHRDIRAVSFNLMYNLTPNQPNYHLHVGGQMASGLTRSIKDRVILDDPANASAKSKVRNGMINLNGVGRIILQPDHRWSPYFEGKLGVHGSGADQLIRLNRSHPNYDRRNLNELTRKAGLSWGYAAGVLFKINELADFDIRLSYLYAKTARYIDMDSYDINENLISYDLAISPANFLGLHIGFRSKVFCNSYNNSTSESRSEKKHRRNKKKPRTKKAPTPSTNKN